MAMDTTQSKNKGKLEVVCGSMFSGKSEELIRRLRRAKIARQTVVTFKHSLDDRHEIAYVVSHDGNKLNAHPIDNPQDILQFVIDNNIHVVGIDEVQFFPNEIVRIICELVEAGRHVIAAGLDIDFRGMPFGCMPTLLAVADSVTKLKAICTICGKDAHHTQRLINDKPAKFDDPIILIGAEDAYQARCRNCFVIDKLPQKYGQKQSNL